MDWGRARCADGLQYLCGVHPLSRSKLASNKFRRCDARASTGSGLGTSAFYCSLRPSMEHLIAKAVQAEKKRVGVLAADFVTRHLSRRRGSTQGKQSRGYSGGTHLSQGGRKADRVHIAVGASVIAAHRLTSSAWKRKARGSVSPRAWAASRRDSAWPGPHMASPVQPRLPAVTGPAIMLQHDHRNLG